MPRPFVDLMDVDLDKISLETKEDKKKDDIGYTTVPIRYTYEDGTVEKFRIRYPLMTGSGIREKTFDKNQGPKRQVSSCALSTEEVAKLDSIRKRLLTLLARFADKDNKADYIPKLEDIDFTNFSSKNKTLKQIKGEFCTAGKDGKTKRTYFKVNQYSVFNLVDKKAPKNYRPVKHENLYEDLVGRIELEHRPILDIPHFYIGVQISLIHQLGQTLIKKMSSASEANDQDEEANEWANEADEDADEMLANLRAGASNLKKNEEESDGSDNENATASSSKSKIGTKLTQILDDDDVPVNPKPKKTKKPRH